jgi:hypothetical protein
MSGGEVDVAEAAARTHESNKNVGGLGFLLGASHLLKIGGADGLTESSRRTDD